MAVAMITKIRGYGSGLGMPFSNSVSLRMHKASSLLELNNTNIPTFLLLTHKVAKIRHKQDCTTTKWPVKYIQFH